MSAVEVPLGRRIGSTSLVADAWNDAVDILSPAWRWRPSRSLDSIPRGSWRPIAMAARSSGPSSYDRPACRAEASLELADTMPDPRLTAELRRVAMRVPGVLGVEKQLARKTGLRYHVDLHLEVDPDMTVRKSHDIAHEVKRQC